MVIDKIATFSDELDTLQSLHSWRAEKIHPDRVIFAYRNEYKVSLPCHNYHPNYQQLSITLIDEQQTIRRREDFPNLSQHLRQSARSCVVNSKVKFTTMKQVGKILLLLNISHP